ncbi:hypothetical protein A2Y85_06015 [candidate division WOR-3 bacterium RBG_13_43_14]|uniref:Secretion system C-terminal sorting domain-containing protein n=1 Tax=candidate division WOR-3 bacterium RBG_13_43_14 TaxID=1802590 RepID=A0A1F4U1V3_UNCW3|nr:MAG: hypothetical protein A2Y85_06015 [candidate division WOR-3 bacterium RBG_13_43_14]
MKSLFIIFTHACVLFANPIWVEIINEFQTAPTSLERVEYRFFSSPSSDTFYFDSISLLNTSIKTPSGPAIVDTQLFLRGTGHTTVNGSVVSGPFGLPDSNGFIVVNIGIGYPTDSVSYPPMAPAPPYNHSSAKYHCFLYNSADNEYSVVPDWYFDPTPTFGASNDDYPGCRISGYVYDNNNQPLANAKVKVTPYYWGFYTVLIRTPPYYVTCSTMTEIDGAYTIDSLQPWNYYVIASINGYLTDTINVYSLKALNPLTNINFNLIFGISEDETEKNMSRNLTFQNPTNGLSLIGIYGEQTDIRIYDISGRLVKDLSPLISNTPSIVTWDGTDQSSRGLPAGMYFIHTKTHGSSIIKKLIRIE